MTTDPRTPANLPQPPPAAAALGFAFGVAILGFVAMFSAAALA